VTHLARLLAYTVTAWAAMWLTGKGAALLMLRGPSVATDVVYFLAHVLTAPLLAFHSLATGTGGPPWPWMAAALFWGVFATLVHAAIGRRRARSARRGVVPTTTP